VVWFHCEAKLVSHKNGQPWFIHGVGFDVTELKRTEQALQEASAERERLQKIALDRQIAKTEQMESQLSAIVESSEDAIIGTDLDGAITSWNAAATGVFGYQPEEVLGKSVLMLIPPELHDEEMENLGKLRRGVRIEHQETQRIAKVGARLDVSLTISPIKDQDGRVIGGSKIVRDITERKRSEEKLRITEKLAATGRLAATIAHEVNNPLEAVTNLLYLARTNFGMSAEARRYLETADEELARIAHLTKQTLGFYRDGSSPSQFNVADAIESVLAIYSQRAANRDVQFEKQLDPSIRVLAYPGEFRQVISNLLVNAIDAMTGRGGRLVIRARRSANHNKVRISVADTGAGIPAASKKKIFEAFYTTKAEVGTGLGLWLSRTLVEKHGGSIRVRSRTDSPQGGTVFSIFWPIEPVQKMSEPS
jgi:PAS domain S-box-containing protein